MPEAYKYVSFKSFDPQKPLILIDFDHTVSNFDPMKASIIKKCESIGITKEQWEQSYKNSSKDVGVGIHIVQMDEQIKLLSEMFKKDEKLVRDIFYSEFNAGKKYIFDDVIEFLEINSQNANIVIFSLGTEQFQFAKRESSGMDEYLTGALYTTTQKDVWLNTQMQFIEDRSIKIQVKCLNAAFDYIYVIDDRPSNLEGFDSKYYPQLKLIRLRREDGKYSKEEFTKDVKAYEVKRLLEFKMI